MANENAPAAAESEAAARELLETLLATNDALLKRVGRLESAMSAAAESLNAFGDVLRAHQGRLDRLAPEQRAAPLEIQ